MFEQIVFYLILLVACVICARAMTMPRSSSATHRLPAPKDQSIDESTPSVAPMKPLPKWRPFQLEANVIVCPCGQWNHPDAETCWSCDRSFTSTRTRTFTIEATERCDVCAYWIYPADRVALCPACKAQGHYAHLFEYVKAKGQCPRCSRKLVPAQLLIAAILQNRPVDAVVVASKAE